MKLYDKFRVQKDISFDWLQFGEKQDCTIDEVLLAAAVPCTRLNFASVSDLDELMKSIKMHLSKARVRLENMTKEDTLKFLAETWLPGLPDKKKLSMLSSYKMIENINEEGRVSFNQTLVKSWMSIWEKEGRGAHAIEYGTAKPSAEKTEPRMLNISSWEEFADAAKTEATYENRILLLDKAHEVFAGTKAFNDMDMPVKKALAGLLANCSVEESVDWQLFGAMSGAGSYSHDIGQTDSVFGAAIDLIPLEGEVTKEDFDAYCKILNGWKNPIAIASRLLAIKRPDLFVCWDVKNIDRLAYLTKNKKNLFTWSEYWNVHEKSIWSSPWYKTPESSVPDDERKLWKYRVAMLDCITWAPDPEEEEGKK